ncbi:hypothetical protein [Capnocytophaga canis]|uniref:hypothetical protein n=1 Tax=Capnocytophaga canis TaxID=1848903 RepID=UPI0037D5C58B
MERLYKNKKEKDNAFYLDDRHELFSVYRSKCAFCKYFNKHDYYCKAFPNGIPDEYLSGESVHNKVDSRQVGESVFIEKS